MIRQVLTRVKENGEIEDLIPYVDALAVKVNGSNLKEVLTAINDHIKANNLFKGAFSSETTLLATYPNGSELPQGTYAVVTDEDAIYIYDVETLTWKRTATSALSIVEINGITATNGSLTLTGGDIIANVPSAEVDEQSITNHLETLYSKSNDASLITNGTIAVEQAEPSSVVDSTNVIFNTQISSAFAKSSYIGMKFRKPSNVTASDDSKSVKIQITYSDGTTKKLSLYSADGLTIKYKDIKDYMGMSTLVTEIDVLLRIKGNSATLINIYKGLQRTVSTTYTLSTSNWIDNEEGTGYKYVITADSSIYTNSYVVLGVYKENNGIKTTAIVDYKTQSNVITIYSDEKFAGGVTIQYIAG